MYTYETELSELTGNCDEHDAVFVRVDYDVETSYHMLSARSPVQIEPEWAEDGYVVNYVEYSLVTAPEGFVLEPVLKAVKGTAAEDSFLARLAERAYDARCDYADNWGPDEY